ncbi:hypothetical protein Tco_1479128, partial [Tanacetum coccineum]
TSSAMWKAPLDCGKDSVPRLLAVPDGVSICWVECLGELNPSSSTSRRSLTQYKEQSSCW